MFFVSLLMGVTEVVRGRDLLLSSPQQIYLAGMLGGQSPFHSSAVAVQQCWTAIV